MKPSKDKQGRLRKSNKVAELKIKCSKCNRAYARSFINGKPFCARCNPPKSSCSRTGRISK